MNPSRGLSVFTRRERTETLAAYLFLSPFLVGLIIFVGGPIVAAIVISFTKWDLLTRPVFIGLENYRNAFRDVLFLKAIRNTLIYTVGSIPLGAIPALLLALALNKGFPGISVFRSLYLLPSTISIVAIGVAWSWIFNGQFGVVNYILRQLQLPTPNWLGSAQWALPVVMLVGSWRNLGYSVIIILAGLQNISLEYYDSAKIDGASSWKVFTHITFPMLSPTNFFLTIMSIIWSFQVFEITYIMTKEGPQASTLTWVYYIWENGFPWYRMGYASAIAFLLFIFMLVVCIALVRYQDRWVHYE